MALSLIFFLFVLFNRLRASEHITCTDNEDCTVDCSTNSGGRDCSSFTITASTASSLIVKCSSSYSVSTGQRCDHMTIYCPYSTTATCRIDCDDHQCQYTTINYPIPQNLYINCYGGYSCTNLQVLGPKTYSNSALENTATIRCYSTSSSNNDYSQCKHAYFDMNYITNVDIKCSNKYSSSVPNQDRAACYDVTFNAIYATNINILCHMGDCYTAQIYANYVSNQLSVNCDYSSGCWYLTVYAYHANYVDINCAAQISSCSQMTIKGNSEKENALNIKCGYYSNGWSCDMDIYASDDYVLNWMSFNEGVHTDIPNNIRIHCDSRGEQKIAYDSVTETFRCIGKSLCCPWKYGDIVCNEINSNQNHSDCIIDCTQINGCNNKVIDAVNAPSLTVICDKNESICASSTIFGPRNMVHKYGGDNLTLNIQCLSVEGCNSSNIYAYSSNYFNILCKNTNACSSINLNLDTTNNTEIICNGDYSCINASISANNAIVFNGVFTGNAAIQNGVIYGKYISNVFSIRCGNRYSIATNKYTACQNVKIYGKTNGDGILTNLNCESNGCAYLNLYSENGVSDWNISINGCQECNGINQCINRWHFYCDFHRIYYDGTSCIGDTTGLCRCNTSIFDNGYVQNADICMLAKPDIICDENINCNINCDNSTNCHSLSITGSKSLSLTVNCNDEYSCLSTIIYCPFNDTTLCTINCYSENSCNLMEIYGSNNSVMQLNCLNDNSCNTLAIYAKYSNNLEINCINNSACNYFNVYADYS
eukprot:437411_1